MTTTIEAHKVEPDATRADRRSAEARRQTRRRLVVVGIVIAAAVSFLLYKTLAGAVTYFKTVDQALAARTALGTTTFQLEGLVVPHTIRRPDATTVDFRIEGTRHDEISVVNTGEPPELFESNVPVVIVGHFVGSSNEFVSDQILVKHSNSYIAAHPTRVTAPNGSAR